MPAVHLVALLATVVKAVVVAHFHLAIVAADLAIVDLHHLHHLAVDAVATVVAAMVAEVAVVADAAVV